MLKISGIKLPVIHTEQDIANKIVKVLNSGHIKDMPDFSYKIIRRSIDARKKPDIFYLYSVAITLPDDTEASILRKLCKDNSDKSHGKKSNKSKLNVSKYEPVIYTPPENAALKPDKSPVIAGEGPAGLFAGLILAYAGFKPVIIERGDSVDKRIKAVNEFWNTGKLDTHTNVQFGEGGAGTFSDGKLNTGVNDKRGLNQFVLDTFVKYGANETCAYDFMPHIGTDRLAKVVSNIRNEIIDRGGRVIHLATLTDTVIKNNKICSIIVECKNNIDNAGINQIKNIVPGLYEIDCDDLIIAAGHSARDTFRMLNKHNIPMQQKDFAVGLRIQHTQEFINKTQYGDACSMLPPASYKLTNKTKEGRAVFSFCMCPGGYVVNASSEEGHLCVNGMSNSKRDSANANSAIIVSVTPSDFNCENNIFSGMEFQEELEKKAYTAGCGKIPVQKYGDFCDNKISDNFDNIKTSFKGEIQCANLRDVLPENISLSIIESMEKFGYTLKGFDDGDSVLAGVESRTSSPLRIIRDENFESSIKGIFPCGEGAGYAGGIMSAAIDGIKVAEAVIKKYENHNY